MTKAEMIAKVHESLESKVSRKEAEKALDTVFGVIRDEFLAGRDVTVSGFGSFKVKTRAAREARNPKTGETIHVDEQKTVTFKPVAKLKEDLNHKA